MDKYKDLKHLCFDKDGVLIDVHAYWSHTTKIRADFFKNKFHLTDLQTSKLIEAMGINTTTEKIKRSGPIGYKPREKVIDSLRKKLEEFLIKTDYPDIVEDFKNIDEYQQRKGDFKILLIEGVREFLEKNKNKFSMSVFTSDRKKNAELSLKNCDILNYFDIVLGGDDVQSSKPNPEGILIACDKIDCDTSHTAYLSDTSSDLLMAKQANLPVKIGLLTGLGNKKQLKMYGDLICDNLTELNNYFL